MITGSRALSANIDIGNVRNMTVVFHSINVFEL